MRRSNNTRNHKIKVVETGEVYDNSKECAKAIGGTPNGIRDTIRGVQNSHRGYTFVLAGE